MLFTVHQQCHQVCLKGMECFLFWKIFSSITVKSIILRRKAFLRKKISSNLVRHTYLLVLRYYWFYLPNVKKLQFLTLILAGWWVLFDVTDYWGLFRTLSNTWWRFMQKLLAVTYFCKTLHYRFLKEFLLYLCMLTGKTNQSLNW